MLLKGKIKKIKKLVVIFKTLTSLSSFEECKFVFIGNEFETNFLARLDIGSSSSHAKENNSLYCLCNMK